MEEQRIKLTRQELYERVWTTPVSRIAPGLGISDVGLRKICQRYEIPLPPVGYWAKKQHGKRVRRTPLPEVEEPDGQPLEFWCRPAGSRASGSTSEATNFYEREQLPENKIGVSGSLDAPHPLVERTLRSLASAKPNEVGLVEPKAKRCLNVTVSPESVARAMLIMDALVKALEARGLKIAATPDLEQAATIKVLDERLTFLLEELTESRKRKLTKEEKSEVEMWGFSREIPRYERFPSGRLSLVISNGPLGARHRWSDSGRQKLEQLLNAFVRGLARNAEGRKLARIEDEQRRREWQKREQERREAAEQRRLEEERRRAEEARFKELEEMAANWRRSEQIRSFLDAVESAARAHNCEAALEGELGQWVVWARQQADRIDPINGAFTAEDKEEVHVHA